MRYFRPSAAAAAAPDLSGYATEADLAAVIAAIPAAPDLSGYATEAELAAAIAAIPAPAGGGNPTHMACLLGNRIITASNLDTFPAEFVMKTDADHFLYDPAGLKYKITLKTTGVYRVTGKVNVPGLLFGFGHYNPQGGNASAFYGGAGYSAANQELLHGSLIAVSSGEYIIENRVANSYLNLHTRNTLSQDATMYGRNSTGIFGPVLNYVMIERLRDLPA